MSVQTVGVDFLRDSSGAYITVTLPDGRTTTVGPFNAEQSQCLTGVLPPEQTKPAKRKVSPKQNRKRSMEQEDEIAARYGTTRTRGSGASKYSKSDVRVVGHCRYEAKYTRSNQYILKLDELNKLVGETSGLEVPIFEVHFLDDQEKARAKWLLLPEWHFQFMEYKTPYATTLHR